MTTGVIVALPFVLSGLAALVGAFNAANRADGTSNTTAVVGALLAAGFLLSIGAILAGIV